jgi:hypothetical protein
VKQNSLLNFQPQKHGVGLLEVEVIRIRWTSQRVRCLTEQDRGTVSSHVRLEDAQDQARPEEELCLNNVAG